MSKLDGDFLREVGLGALPPEEANSLLCHCHAELELRVGTSLAEQLSRAQLDEFEEFLDGHDDVGVIGWLERMIPDYRYIARARFTELKSEVAAARDAILAPFVQSAA